MIRLAILTAFLSAASLQAQLAVTVSPPKIVAQKAVVPLGLKNNFPETIESARAVVFLLDEHGKMVNQTTRWVIGGTPDKAGLAAGATNAFHFVITAENSFPSTNLTAKVTFTRVVLAGGKVADPEKDVQIQK